MKKKVSENLRIFLLFLLIAELFFVYSFDGIKDSIKTGQTFFSPDGELLRSINLGGGEGETLINICENGLKYGECSEWLPRYCYNGTLTHKCQICGCPSYYTCTENGTCASPFLLIKNNMAIKIDWNNLKSLSVEELSLELDNKEDGIKINDSEQNYSVYIIEFSDKPIIEKKFELERSLGYAASLSQISSYKDQVIINHEDIKSEIKNALPQIKITGEFFNTFNGISIDISFENLKYIKKSEKIKNIYPDYPVYTTLMDSAPLIGVDRVWNMQINGTNLTGKGVTIGIIDTGVDYTHPDLGGCFGVGCKVEGGWDIANNDSDPIDEIGHGTHVASIAAGKGVLNGVAPEATIYSYKVFNNFGGTWSNVIGAIERSVDPNQDGDFSDHLDVISLSLGGYGEPGNPVSNSINNAVDVGVISVVSAGNAGLGGIGVIGVTTPANAENAITVGATYKKDYQNFYNNDPSCDDGYSKYSSCNCVNSTTSICNYWGDDNPRVDQITSFSSKGPTLIGIKPDVVAPGAIICAARFDSTFPEGKDPYYYPCFDKEHIQLAGTSMSAPIVSGIAALIKQSNQSLNPKEVKERLKSSSENLGYSVLYQGSGRVNALKAVNPDIVITPHSLDLGTVNHNNINTTNFTLKNLANKSIGIEILINPVSNISGSGFNIISFESADALSNLFCLEPNEQKDITLNFNFKNLKKDFYFGSINIDVYNDCEFKDYEREIVLPVSFSILNRLNLHYITNIFYNEEEDKWYNLYLLNDPFNEFEETGDYYIRTEKIASKEGNITIYPLYFEHFHNKSIDKFDIFIEGITNADFGKKWRMSFISDTIDYTNTDNMTLDFYESGAKEASTNVKEILNEKNMTLYQIIYNPISWYHIAPIYNLAQKPYPYYYSNPPYFPEITNFSFGFKLDNKIFPVPNSIFLFSARENGKSINEGDLMYLPVEMYFNWNRDAPYPITANKSNVSIFVNNSKISQKTYSFYDSLKYSNKYVLNFYKFPSMYGGFIDIIVPNNKYVYILNPICTFPEYLCLSTYHFFNYNNFNQDIESWQDREIYTYNIFAPVNGICKPFNKREQYNFLKPPLKQSLEIENFDPYAAIYGVFRDEEKSMIFPSRFDAKDTTFVSIKKPDGSVKEVSDVSFYIYCDNLYEEVYTNIPDFGNCDVGTYQIDWLADISKEDVLYMHDEFEYDGEKWNYDKINNPPVPIIDTPYSYQEFFVGQEIFFDGSSSYDVDGDELTYYWDMGMCSMIEGGKNITWVYTIPNNYTIILGVSDGDKYENIHVRIIVKSPVCSDTNSDGKVTSADIIYLVNFIFKGGPAPANLNAADVNGDGHISAADVIYLVNSVFKGGPAPICGTQISPVNVQTTYTQTELQETQSSLNNAGLSIDIIPPIRSNGKPTGTLSSSTTSTTISLTTDEIATCKYSTVSNVLYDYMTNSFSAIDTTTHSKLITGLTNGKTYKYYVKCKDSSGNKNSDDYLISFSVASTTVPKVSSFN